MDFIFDEIPNRLVPFDYAAFERSPAVFKVVATDCHTGRPVYFEKAHFDPQLTPLRASSSLPLVSPMVSYRGLSLLDGGIADPLPIHRAMADGFVKNVVILTRNRGYQKEPVHCPELLLHRIKYRRYPALVETIKRKHIIYNEALSCIEDLEKEGLAVVIRPTAKLAVGRYERNEEKLLDLYRQGYEDAAAALEKISLLLS
jgi:predicted patatin/cPLA2 family phospholipase